MMHFSLTYSITTIYLCYIHQKLLARLSVWAVLSYVCRAYMPHLTHTHISPLKKKSQEIKRTNRYYCQVSHQRGLSFFSFFSFVSACPHPRPSASPSRSQASGSCATGTSAHPLTGTCRPCRMYMWAAHGARSPGPPPAWSLYLGCMYNEAPPLGGTRAAWLLLGRRAWLASSAPPTYLIPPAATAVVPHKFLFFRLLRLFLSLPFLSALPLRVDEQLHASNHARRCEWTRDRAAEPISAIPDFIAAQAAQPQPHPPTGFFLLFLSLPSRSCAFPRSSRLHRAWLDNSAFRLSRLLISGSRR